MEYCKQSDSTLSGIMLVTNKLGGKPAGGRELLCKLNYDVLTEIYGNQLTVFELTKIPLRQFQLALYAFKGYIDGIDAGAISNILHAIASKNIWQIFVDGSNLGEVVRIIKFHYPKVQVYTFFHNVEARFFWDSFMHSMTAHSLAVLVANFLAERKAVRYSDHAICLNKRDSDFLHKLYGRSATHISPMALQDQLSPSTFEINDQPAQKFALFVGGVFYANLFGITWFVRHVAPRINIKIYIVGRGFEKFKSKLELDGKVEVVGPVDSLAEWYLRSHFVIAPIFDGSGMKTKVAEALMFGKRIIGTPEAFVGYEDIADRAGCMCETAEDFISSIADEADLPWKPFDPTLRALYEDKYSYQAALTRLSAIMNSKI